MSFLDDFRAAFDSGTLRTLAAYCDIEGADSATSLVTRFGGLASVIRIHGATSLVGVEEITNSVKALTGLTRTLLLHPGHGLEWHFLRDPSRRHERMRSSMAGVRSSAARRHLDVAQLLDEQEEHLGRYLAHEDAFLVVWSYPSLLRKGDGKEEEDLLARARKAAPRMRHAQWSWRATDTLRRRHEAATRDVMRVLGSCQIRAVVLSAHDALIAMRESIYPFRAGDNWRPALASDRLWPRLDAGRPKAGDHSGLFWTRLSQQIFPAGGGDGKVLGRTVARIGEALWTFCDMTIGPDRVLPFASLLNNMLSGDAEMPWRFSLLMEGGGLNGKGFASTLAQILSVLGPLGGDTNKKIRASLTSMRNYALADGVPVRLRVSMATWARDDGTDEAQRLVQRRGQQMMRQFMGWGGLQADQGAGDPLEGVMGSTLGLRPGMTAPSLAAPTEDACLMTPITRPTFPFDSGTVFLRSPDGKFIPYMPGSSQQTYWMSVVIGPPGSGKSVTMNMINMGYVLTPPIGRDSRLPLLGILDFGHSTVGLISQLSAALPEDRQHEVLHVRLRNSRDMAFNPFDTQLGARYPLPAERSFLRSFLLVGMTEPGRNSYDAMPDLISRAIDAAYDLRADGGNGQPMRYQSGLDAKVDAAMVETGLCLPDRPLWWEVVDGLFAAGRPHEATLAQRHAVPRLGQDLIEAARLPRILSEFEGAMAPTGETLINAFSRCVRSMVEFYPVLSDVTRFDLRGARVVAFDLQDVAPTGSDDALKQTGLMYLFARQMLARDWFLHTDDLPSFPPAYQDYQRERIEQLMSTPRRLQYDEFHRPAKHPLVVEQAQLDVKTGRKNGLQLVFITQEARDLPDSFITLTSDVWILKVGQGDDRAIVKTKFSLTKAQEELLPYLGPGPDGARMLISMETNRGRYCHDAILSIGPRQLWAFSTTFEDNALRSILYQRVGPNAARLALAAAFRGGSARSEIERRRDAGEVDVIETIAEEVLAIGRALT